MADTLEKFSDFTEADPSTLEAAGSIVPSAVPGVGNNKSTWTSIKNWIKSWMLGETSALAYRGDRGKIAYDHSQTTGNPHGATAADVGAAASLHGDQHGYGESDQISIDTRQISNMSAFGRSLVDDASAADARTTLGAAASSHAHGAVTTDGKIGTTAGLPVTTGTGGALQAVAWSTTAPVMNGTASVGTSVVPSRSDHVHPGDASKANLTTIANQSGGWHELGFCDLPGATYGRVYGSCSIVGRGVDCSFDFVVERSISDNSVGYGFTYNAALSANPPKVGHETLADGTTVRIRWFVFCGSNHSAKVSYTVGSSLGDLSSLTTQTHIGATLPSISYLAASEYIGVCNAVGTLTGYVDKIGGSDTTALTANVQTQLNGKVGKTGDETIAGSKTFSAVPTVPNQPPESVGSGATNAQFVADKVYPGYRGTDITATGSITPVHAELRKVNADGLTITLTNTPVLGTVSWLYYTPVSCSTGGLTLSFTDVMGTTRTYQKTATSGANHLPHLIKLVRALDGWIVEWETEA